MDFGGPNQSRLIGDYIIGTRLGFGSFAVVWHSRHRQSGLEVAIKEIDKKQLRQKVSENLLKEISILSTTNHPNIIRLYEVIETQDRIYLVLEYCDRGDLAAYIQHHGKVPEIVASHFMGQLAAGLKVLHEKHLIHRDLKPQNLLLATNGTYPLLKIGDFGFARSLSDGLADTLCGSPLYMAPEIIQNQKYDAKADLWSVGAILFQLVTGRPPFEGNSQLQLFQNILASTELHFPPEATKELHPDCLDLCRSLLRLNPVERLTFEEFFNHKFLREPRSLVYVEPSLPVPSEDLMDEQSECSPSVKRSQLNTGEPSAAAFPGESSTKKLIPTTSFGNEGPNLERNSRGKTASSGNIHGFTLTSTDREKVKDYIGVDVHPKNQHEDSMESIERDYILVNPHFASVEAFSFYLGTSVQETSSNKMSICPSKGDDHEVKVKVAGQTMEPVTCSAEEVKLESQNVSSTSSILRKVKGISLLHPSTRLQLLYHYIQILSDISDEKYKAELYLESFAVELVVLAVWKKALDICNSWLNSDGSTSPESSLTDKSTFCLEGMSLPERTDENLDFSDALSVSSWAKRGFVDAFEHAEKSSLHIPSIDGEAEMPDAMKIIYDKALSYGKSGAVDEYMESKGSAMVSYSKAIVLLFFIVGEAETLPLRPPFVLSEVSKEFILKFILNLQSRQTRSSTLSHTNIPSTSRNI